MNSRPLDPQSSTLTKLRYTPTTKIILTQISLRRNHESRAPLWYTLWMFCNRLLKTRFTARFKTRITARITAMLAAIILTAVSLSACSTIRDISDVADTITQDLPTAADTLTSMKEINAAIMDAMSRGETELTFNAADVNENELRSIGNNLSTFWGKPVVYSINREFEDVEGIIPGRAVNVKSITNTFELSSNFYVYDFIRNGTPIPEGKLRAAGIADALPGIAAEIFTEPVASDYEKTLMAHDWLVANIEYDDTMPSISEENGSYGAIVLRRTMCQGYAEAFELLLKCYTDIEITQIVGEALSFAGAGHDQAETDAAESDAEAETEAVEGASSDAIDSPEGDADQASDPVGTWGGHAWNIVKLDGVWYHIDATFDDPKGNAYGRVSHVYFGQTDEIMLFNHSWTRELFPAAGTEDFLFFKKSELYTDGWHEFEFTMSERLTASPIDYLEIITKDIVIDAENIQFIFDSRNELVEIWWGEQTWNEISAKSFEFIYSE